MAFPKPPRSPTLEVPRKSVELEDPGAHELDESSDDGQVFSDARTSILTPLTIPTTRVEKVDSSPSHGEVPGTPAYEKRTQDAVPDEIEVIPEGSRSRASSRAMNSPLPISPSHSPIPKTRVEKIDPASPSYGEVPGTPAWEKRKADAKPDAVENASPVPSLPPTPTTIPRTVITRVDSEPAHGEVPGTDAYDKRKQDAEPDIVEKKGDVPIVVDRSSYFRRVMPSSTEGATPIAEDGGFGPMGYESDEDMDDEQNEDEEGFDDFAAGGNEDDFGDFDDFDDGFQAAETTAPSPVPQQQVVVEPPEFPVLDFSEPYSLESLMDAISPHTKAVFPALQDLPDEERLPAPESNSAFLTERSLSLWQQLVAPPPLQPPNWVRSRIRRLFLVSLGVPVDLDEILPKSKQKKLVLQYSPEAQKGGKRASIIKTADGASQPEDESPATATTKSTKKRRGPPPPPDFSSSEVHGLCHKTEADLESMTDEELRKHVKRLEVLLDTGKDVLQYWVRRKETAVGEKEAFDGVIENLVRHARRVRK